MKNDDNLNWPTAFFLLIFLAFYLYGFVFVSGWWWVLAVLFPLYTPYLSLVNLIDFIGKVIMILIGAPT